MKWYEIGSRILLGLVVLTTCLAIYGVVNGVSMRRAALAELTCYHVEMNRCVVYVRKGSIMEEKFNRALRQIEMLEK